MRQRTSHRRCVWLGVLFGILGGVIGMHGLGSHGVAGTTTGHGAIPNNPDHGVAGHSAPVLAATAAAETGHAAAGAVAAAAFVHGGSAAARAGGEVTGKAVAGWADRSTLDPGEDDVPMVAIAGLCLAVLLAGAAGWALLPRTTPCTGTVLRLLRTSTSVAAAGRDRDPPSLTMLCLRRC